MKNPELYHRTINILSKAYLNGTLRAGHCASCAVGNIIAENNDFEVTCYYDEDTACWWGDWHSKDGFHIIPKWDDVFVTNAWGQKIHLDKYTDSAKEQIDSSGYSFYELAQIEKAFEISTFNSFDNDIEYEGLMAVVDVLDKIHENTDTKITTETKTKFVKPVLTPYTYHAR